MSTTPTAAIEALLGLPPLQVVVEIEADCTAPTIFKNQIGHILLFSRWRRKISHFYWLLLTVCYPGNIWWNISLGRYGYLELKHGFLPMA
jgi:hypothetical protein